MCIATSTNGDSPSNSKEATRPTNTATATATSSVCGQLGDLFNYASLANVVAYAAAVILYAHLPDEGTVDNIATAGNDNTTATAATPLFDEEWLREGFCVVNKDVPYLNSHDLCLYADFILVALAFAVYYCLKKNSWMENANEMVFYGLLGHLGHGLAHGAIGAKYRENGGQSMSDVDDYANHFERMQHEEWTSVAFSVVMGTIFWFGLLKSVMAKFRHRDAFALAVLANLGGMLVRRQLGFMYVQTVLGVAYTVVQTRMPPTDKADFAYPAFALAGVALSVIPWVEATACTAFAGRYFGGHLIYDAAIPIFIMTAYLSCYFHGRQRWVVVKEKQL